MIHEGQREQATNLRHWPEIVKVELKRGNFCPSQTFVNIVQSETCRCFLGLFICQKQLNTAEINSSLRFILTLSVLKGLFLCPFVYVVLGTEGKGSFSSLIFSSTLLQFPALLTKTSGCVFMRFYTA